MQKNKDISFFSLFTDYNIDDVLDVVEKLPKEDFELLIKAFGEDLTILDRTKLTDIEYKQLINICRNEIVKNLEKNVDDFNKDKFEELVQIEEDDIILEDYDLSTKRQRIKRTSKAYLSDNVFRDRFSNLPYKKLSPQEEIDFMKKLKLSYYEDVDLEKQKLYIKYYGEIFPDWYKQYNEAEGIHKKELLDKAIEQSYLYRDEFIYNNIRLVIHFAKNFSGADAMENLCQEGIIGMMRAIEKFDIEKGYRFSSFAKKSIWRTIATYLYNTKRTIRITGKKVEMIFKLNKIETDYMQKYREKPSDEVLMEKMGINQKQLDELKRCKKLGKTTSLDEPVNDDEKSGTFGDFIEDKNAEFEEKVTSSMMLDFLIDKIDGIDLSPRDKRVVYMRYGIKYFDKPYSYSDVAKEFGISVERVRQIEARLLTRLKEKLVLEYRKEEKVVKKKPIYNFKVKETLEERMQDEEFSRIREGLQYCDLNMLDSQTRYIISKIYGLDGICLTDATLAERLGYSLQEIIDIEKGALRKLDLLDCAKSLGKIL